MPRVSNDKTFSEAMFGTMKNRPGFPFKGSYILDSARIWAEKSVKPHQYHSGNISGSLKREKI